MFPFLFRKKNLNRTALLRGMTDVHTHLLPGVDDGFESLDAAGEMLAYLQEIGIRRLFLTPHVSDEWPANTPAALSVRYGQLKQIAPDGIELFLAAEYMLDAGFRGRMNEGLLVLPGKQVLVETSYLAAPFDFYNLLYDLSLEGYTPVIAHPERYAYMTEIDYYLLKGKGYKFQLNFFSLCNLYGPAACRKARVLLEQGLYDFAGSDCHSASHYKAGLERLALTCRQINDLQRLLENNAAL